MTAIMRGAVLNQHWRIPAIGVKLLKISVSKDRLPWKGLFYMQETVFIPVFWRVTFPCLVWNQDFLVGSNTYPGRKAWCFQIFSKPLAVSPPQCVSNPPRPGWVDDAPPECRHDGCPTLRQWGHNPFICMKGTPITRNWKSTFTAFRQHPVRYEQ